MSDRSKTGVLICAHTRCRKPGGIYIGTSAEGKDGYVCDKHIQYCSASDDGSWRLHRYLADARKAQAAETWI